MRIFMETFPFVDASEVCSSALYANLECFIDLVALKICAAIPCGNQRVRKICSLDVSHARDANEGRF